MQKLALYFVALFILFYACSQDQSDTPSQTQQEKTKLNAGNETKDKGIASTPIAAPKTPPESKGFKEVPQAAKKDLTYPKRFLEMGITKYKGATVTNNNLIENSRGMYGQRINMRCPGTYEEVLKNSMAALVKKGWVQNKEMDKSHEDPDVSHFSTNFTKDNYTLMHAVTRPGSEEIMIMQILKEN